MVNHRFWLAVLLAVLVFSVAEIKPQWKVGPDILDHHQVEFVPHVGANSYLAMNLNYEPMIQLLARVESHFNLELKSRGEAHITVISPPEYSRVLKPFLSIGEINQLALNMNIQSSAFKPLCIGRGEKVDTRRVLATYFVVVESPQLLALRLAVFEQFVLKGGDPKAFDPYAFHPHITLGFSQRDLHLQDGVVKDLRSCIVELAVVE